MAKYYKFQFPSNGKADRKSDRLTFINLAAMRGEQFQFPSNGKADRKCYDEDGEQYGLLMFQFPSNGKADRKGS